MVREVALVVSMLGAELQQPSAAYWVSERADPRLWRDVRVAFHAELQPDDSAKRAPYVALQHKYIARIARVSDVYLVVIGERERAPAMPDLDHFRAFSYDAVSRVKTPIEHRGFSKWEHVQWTALAPRTPELVFTHWSCIECEATYLLSSFVLDTASRTWSLRNWADDSTEIEIGSDWTVGGDVNSRSECVYRIADFSSDRNADLAVWCRESFDDPSRKSHDSIALYTVSSGVVTKTIPDDTQARSLRRALCRGRTSHRLCAGRR